MTTFIDGPAANVRLQLHRAPMVLRAVRDTQGQWDALDQLDDQADPDEFVVVYVVASVPTNYHLRCSRASGGSGWYQAADYREWPKQPPQDVLKDNQQWRAWCEHYREEIKSIYEELLKA